MHILDLPLETLQEILGAAIQVRGRRRGLRLRLVNKLFAEQVQQALFISRLLDSYFKSIQSKRHADLPSLATSYLERRVFNERPDGNSILLHIRRVAERLSQESTNGQGGQDYIKQLCPVVVTNMNNNNDSYKRRPDIWGIDGTVDENDVEIDVYVAAVVTQTTPLVERWIVSGKEANQTSRLFGSALEHAPNNGSHELLAALINTPNTSYSFQSQRISMLCQVARKGRLDAARFVFELKTDRHPWDFSMKSDEFSLAQAVAPDREVFDFIRKKQRIHCIDRDFGSEHMTEALCHCAREGWTDMAAYCLELGALVNGLGRTNIKDSGRPLVIACSYGQQEVVKMLLARGAEPITLALEYAVQKGHFAIVQMLLDHRVGPVSGWILCTASYKGYYGVVEKLFNHGAEMDHQAGSMLEDAIFYENEAMLRLLLEQGCDLGIKPWGPSCISIARKMGLESMLQLLRENEVDVDNIVEEDAELYRVD